MSNATLEPGDGLDPRRSVHTTRRDHCMCEHCRGEGYRTVMLETGGWHTFTCLACKGTGKGLCRHRDDEPSNRERSAT